MIDEECIFLNDQGELDSEAGIKHTSEYISNAEQNGIPIDESVYIMRAMFFLILGRINDALTDFSTALEINPTSPRIYDLRAMVYKNLNKLDLAISDMEKAVELSKPDTEETRRLNELARKDGYISASDQYAEDLEVLYSRIN